jgi:hypothetical protein
MPPKADPYDTPAQRRINLFLWTFSVIVAVVVFFIAAH